MFFTSAVEAMRFSAAGAAEVGGWSACIWLAVVIWWRLDLCLRFLKITGASRVEFGGAWGSGVARMPWTPKMARKRAAEYIMELRVIGKKVIY